MPSPGLSYSPDPGWIIKYELAAEPCNRVIERCMPLLKNKPGHKRVFKMFKTSGNKYRRGQKFRDTYKTNSASYR